MDVKREPEVLLVFVLDMEVVVDVRNLIEIKGQRGEQLTVNPMVMVEDLPGLHPCCTREIWLVYTSWGWKEMSNGEGAEGVQGSTMFYKAQGGGKRCTFEGCDKWAEGSTPYCKGHGGGKNVHLKMMYHAHRVFMAELFSA
nr:hypothetical protein [Tanacetum cinerariifolium]